MNPFLKRLLQFIILVAVLLAVFTIVNGLTGRKAPDDYAGGLLEEPIRSGGMQYIVPPDELIETSINSDDIPVLTNPDFDSILAADQYLSDEVWGLDISVRGEHRFYSYQILNWHPVVEDEFNGERLVITHCPFCRSPRVFATDKTLRLSGLVFNNNFVLEDEDGNLYRQFDGLQIAGDDPGSQLPVYPSTVLRWGDWSEIYSDGRALSNETGFTRDYGRHPYIDYDTSRVIYYPLSNPNTRIDSKWIVNGYTSNGESMTYSRDIMRGFGVSNDTVGDDNIVGIHEEMSGVTRVFSRQVGDRTLTFSYDFASRQITDNETGSVWNTLGLSTSGELAGTQLTQLDAPELFWMCWSSMYPDTVIAKFDNQPGTNTEDSETE